MQDSDKREEAPPRRTRRRFTRQFKAELVAQANSGTISVSQLAIDHRINANQLRKWIAEARRQALPAILPVTVDGAAPTHPMPAAQGMMEMNIHGAVLRFHGQWDPMTVARLIKACQ